MAGTGTPFVMISTGSPTTTIANGNTINNLTRSGATGTIRGIAMTSPTNFTANLNSISNISFTLATSTGSIDGIYGFSSGVNVTANNNFIRDLSVPSTGTISGITEFGAAGNKTFQLNEIYNFTTSAGGAGGSTFRGISASIGNINASQNKIYRYILILTAFLPNLKYRSYALSANKAPINHCLIVCLDSRSLSA